MVPLGGQPGGTIWLPDPAGSDLWRPGTIVRGGSEAQWIGASSRDVAKRNRQHFRLSRCSSIVGYYILGKRR